MAQATFSEGRLRRSPGRSMQKGIEREEAHELANALCGTYPARRHAAVCTQWTIAITGGNSESSAKRDPLQVWPPTVPPWTCHENDGTFLVH